jgi:hypothetical protein
MHVCAVCIVCSVWEFVKLKNSNANTKLGWSTVHYFGTFFPKFHVTKRKVHGSIVLEYIQSATGFYIRHYNYIKTNTAI